MADIALSKGVRQNLLSMQSTVELMSRTQNRLATGKKVNSALDNPTSYFVSAGLENRANDLSRILDSMGLGIKTLEAADNGIKAIKKLIETAQGVARQGLQAASANGKVTTGNAAGLSATTELDALGYDVGDVIRLSDGTNNVDVTVAAATTIQDLMDAVNASTNLRATWSGTQVKFENITGGNVVASMQTDADLTGLEALFGTVATGTGPTTFAGTTNAIRESLGKQFEELKGQIDQIIKDTGYNGVNLLNGDTLKVLFNETNTTSIEIQGVIFNSQGLGLAPRALDGSSTDTTNRWQSDIEINAVLVSLDAALNKVRTQASGFGSNLIVLQTRQDFTKQSILTLNAGSDLLTLADTSEEGANLLALQTRQQLSTQALSLASQTDQAVLRLFG